MPLTEERIVFRIEGITWTLDNLAESDSHLQWVIGQHTPPTGKTFCPSCDLRAPCDMVSLAASGLARSAENARLTEQLRIAAETLNKIARCGCSACGAAPRDLAHARTLADDALIRMSVVE